MGAGCEAQAEGWGAVQEKPFLGTAWDQSKVQGYSQPCAFGDQPQSGQSRCLSPGSVLGSAGAAKLRNLHSIRDSVEPAKHVAGQVEMVF